MRTQIQKWGSTLVVCIPDSLAERAHLQQGIAVNIAMTNDKLVIDLMEEQETSITLETLLAGITEDNIHQEIETGSSVGKEVW
jgi:antitoxin MazE